MTRSSSARRPAARGWNLETESDGALLAQRVDPTTASRAGPFLHGLAADWAARDLGERGLVPGDLLRYVPLVVREIAAGRGVDLLERIDHRYGGLLAATGGDA